MFGPLKKIPRLLQWNGRTRSSRQEAPLLRQLADRQNLLRLAIVWLTTLAVTAFAIGWEVPLRYRVGEIYPHDLRARVDFTLINHVELVNQERQRSEDNQDTVHEKAAYTVRPVFEKYPRGMLLVPRGDAIQERQLDLLKEEHQAYLDSLTQADHWSRGISLFLILSLLTALMVMYVARFQFGLTQSLPMIAGVCVLILATLTLAAVLSQPPWNALLLPMTFTAMVLTLAYNPQFALMMTFALELALTVVLGTSVDHLLIHMGGMGP